MVLSTAARLVQYFTDRLIREYPTLDSDDVQGEFWLAAAEAMKFWKQEGGAAFSTFLWKHLRWTQNAIVNRLVSQGRLHVRLQAGRLTRVEDPIEPGLKDKWDQLLWELKEDERQVLELMVRPSPVFLRYVKQCWRERRLRYPSRKIGSTIQHVHYARFLGLPPMRITRIIRRIQQVAQEVFHDER